MKKYVFKPYSKIFSTLFEHEKKRICAQLQDVVNIEHVGSTAIPGVGGKGIIDIAIAVKKEKMDLISDELQRLGYEFRPTFSTLDRYYFVIYLPDPEEETRRYHVHLTYPESNDWREFIAFRDYLKNHPKEAYEYAEIKRQAAEKANQNGELYRQLKEPVFEKIKNLVKESKDGTNVFTSMTFKKASPEHRNAIMRWLSEPHVIETWDNSPEHRDDILIFINGRKEPSPYWNGMFDYWIGLINDEPYCLLMTSEILSNQSDLPEVWKQYLSSTGRTFSIDFMIGNTKYLGQGLGGPTLEKFTKFIHETIDVSIDTFFIDPADSNPKAKHVYEKGGFQIVATFYRDCQQEKNVKHFLMVKHIK